MGKEVDSGALLLVNRILGIAGSQTGAQRTELDDGTLTQVLEVGSIVRRSRSLPGTDGIFCAILRTNMGAGVTTETATLNPYTPGGANLAPFPDPIPAGFDFWVAGASLIQAGGIAGNFTNALFRTLYDASMIGLAIDEAGQTFGSATAAIPLAFWDDLTLGFGTMEDGTQWLPLGLRIRRGQTLQLDVAATDAVVVDLVLICALVPAALGQDIVAT